jgi:hypothetical protein
VRDGRGAIAIFVRQVCRLLQLRHGRRICRMRDLVRQVGHERDGLTLGHGRLHCDEIIISERNSIQTERAAVISSGRRAASLGQLSRMQVKFG